MNDVMVCWPSYWVDAAVNAGFAARLDGGAIQLIQPFQKELQNYTEDVVSKTAYDAYTDAIEICEHFYKNEVITLGEALVIRKISERIHELRNKK